MLVFFFHTCNYVRAFIKVLLVPCFPFMCSLEAVHPDAYQAFQTSRDLDTVLSKAVSSTDEGCSSPTKKGALTITASLMTPVLPMLVRFADSSEIWHHVYPLTCRYTFAELYSVTSWSSVFTTLTVSHKKCTQYYYMDGFGLQSSPSQYQITISLWCFTLFHFSLFFKSFVVFTMLVFCICFWESGVCVMQLFPLSANTTITIVTWGTEKNVAVCGHSKLSFILHVASQEGWHQAVINSHIW